MPRQDMVDWYLVVHLHAYSLIFACEGEGNDVKSNLRKCFISGLSFYTTEKGLSEAFSQFGQVIEGDSGSGKDTC